MTGTTHPLPLDQHGAGAAGRPLRISVVTETYPPEVNGVSMTLSRVVSGLQQRRHQVQLVRPRQPADAAAATAADPVIQAVANSGSATGRAIGSTGLSQVLMPSLPIPRYPDLRMGLPSRRRLQQLWTAQRPDVVHIATEGPLGHSALLAALALGLPVTSDFRTNFQAYSSHYGIGWLRRPIMAYLRRFHNRTLATMVPTEALRQQLQADGLDNLNVVSRGVDAQGFHPGQRSLALRAQWGAAADDLVITCVGRLAAEKNLALLVQAWQAILQQQPRARLVLVGDGPQRAALQASHPGIVFAGQRRGDDLAAHYASADLFLFPSLTETFGNVTAEAMASGLPVVAFQYAAAAQLIQHGDSGLLVACGDALGFVQAACSLAGDAALRQAMALQARKRACQQGWPAVLARFEQVLHNAVQTAQAAQAWQRVHGAPVQQALDADPLPALTADRQPAA